MLPLQWNILGLVAAYQTFVGPVVGWLEPELWTIGTTLAELPGGRAVFLFMSALTFSAYLVGLRSDRTAPWQHAYRHAAVAAMILVPAIVAGINQRGDGAISIYVGTVLAIPIVTFVHPAVVATWLALAATVIIVSAVSLQGDPDALRATVWIAIRSSVLASVLYVLLDRLRLRAFDRQRQLVRANAFKDTIFRALEHDLRTPTIRIRQVARILEEEAPPTEPEARDLAASLNQALRQGTHIISNLVAIARPVDDPADTGTSDVCSVSTVLEAVVANVGSDAAAKGVGIVVDVDDPDVLAACSADVMLAVLRNLLGNAVKFSYEGDEVRITAHTRDKVIRIEVIDDGIGIPESVLESLDRGDVVRGSHGTAGEVGSGIGLMVARALAASMRSTLRFARRSTGGSVVSFDVPRYLRALRRDL